MDQEKLTQHQPEFEVVDLVSTESLDSGSDNECMEDCDVESEFVHESRRWLRYSSHYRELFEQFYDDARRGQVPETDVVERPRDEVVDNWIWELMDHDIRHLEDYMDE